MDGLFFGMGGGLERPLRKHAGGMFLGRGRVHAQLTASGTDVGRCASSVQPETVLRSDDLFFGMGGGLERPLRKHAGGLLAAPLNRM
jgi:hypothetical protein